MAVTSIVSQLRTTSLEETIKFYVTHLGFSLAFQYEDFYAGVEMNGQMIHLKLVDETDPSVAVVAEGGHLHLYLNVDDVETYAERVTSSGLPFHMPLKQQPWGMLEFQVKDDQGHIICIGQGE